jgi:hypothetical protein
MKMYEGGEEKVHKYLTLALDGDTHQYQLNSRQGVPWSQSEHGSKEEEEEDYNHKHQK